MSKYSNEIIDVTSLKKKYGKLTDKFESLYIFVIYGTNNEAFNQKITKIMKILDNIPDTKKRGFLKSRIFNFQEYVNKNIILENQNKVFLVSEKIEEYDLDKENISTLKLFLHENISYNYGSNYQFDWLQDLITNREYINSITLKNNDIKLTKISLTKKLYLPTETIKNMDLNEQLKKLLDKEKGVKFIISGSSIILKNNQEKIKHSDLIMYSVKEILEDDIWNIYLDCKYKKNLDELQDILNNITNPKIMNKLTFGEDIIKEIGNSMIEKLYCTLEYKNKNINNLDEFDSNNIYPIISKENKSFVNNFEKTYGGAIAIKFY
jgi:hypothetical protein